MLDAEPAVGGQDRGPRPMELVLLGLTGAGALVYRLWTGFRGVTAGRPLTPPMRPAPIA